MTRAAAPPTRRGWCPGVLNPMPTGDGLLVRLHPPGGALTAAQARAVAAAARACGNGFLDVTGRGNLQIRGVREERHAALVERLGSVGLIEPIGAGPIRLTVVSPLAGLDPTDFIDARALAERIEAEARAVEGLPAKACVAVDGGGMLPLDSIEADLRVVAFGRRAAPSLAIGLGHSPRWIGAMCASSAPLAIRGVLARFAAPLRAGQSSARRIKDLPPNLQDELASATGLRPVPASLQRETGPRTGVFSLLDGRAAVLAALPLGRCDADLLERVAGWSERFGNNELRLSPWRGLALPGVAQADIPRLTAEARSAGLILDPADPRLAVLACPGRPACASATTDTHADAARLAEAARTALAGSAKVHVSGCPKGCAHPGSADLTLVGDGGAYRVVPGGSPRDAALTHLPFDEILRRLSAVPASQSLASAFAEVSP
jgi:precorrin-3B synthase